MDDKLTRKSQDALSSAVRRAAADGNPQVDPLHLLVALIAQNGGTTTPLLRAVGADPATVAKDAENRLGRLPRANGQTAQCAGDVPAACCPSSTPPWPGPGK